jgi:hypothetical protein
MINSIIFKYHSRNWIKLCSKRQSINSRSPISDYIEKDDKTNLINERAERILDVVNFQ